MSLENDIDPGTQNEVIFSQVHETNDSTSTPLIMQDRSVGQDESKTMLKSPSGKTSSNGGQNRSQVKLDDILMSAYKQHNQTGQSGEGTTAAASMQGRPFLINIQTEDSRDVGYDSMSSMKQIRVHDELKIAKRRITEDTTVNHYSQVNESMNNDSKIQFMPCGGADETQTQLRTSPGSRQGRNSSMNLNESQMSFNQEQLQKQRPILILPYSPSPSPQLPLLPVSQSMIITSALAPGNIKKAKNGASPPPISRYHQHAQHSLIKPPKRVSGSMVSKSVLSKQLQDARRTNGQPDINNDMPLCYKWVYQSPQKTSSPRGQASSRMTRGYYKQVRIDSQGNEIKEENYIQKIKDQAEAILEDTMQKLYESGEFSHLNDPFENHVKVQDWDAVRQERSEKFTNYVHAQITKEKELVKADLLTKLNSLTEMKKQHNQAQQSHHYQNMGMPNQFTSPHGTDFQFHEMRSPPLNLSPSARIHNHRGLKLPGIIDNTTKMYQTKQDFYMNGLFGAPHEDRTRYSLSPMSQQQIQMEEKTLYDQQQTFNLLQKFYKQKILDQSDSMSPRRLEQLLRVEKNMQLYQRTYSKKDKQNTHDFFSSGSKDTHSIIDSDESVEKYFDTDRGSRDTKGKNAEQELKKAIKYAEKFKSEGFRKKMHMHNVVGLSGEYAPDAISKLHPPLTQAHVHWYYETGRVNGSQQLLKRSIVHRERGFEKRFGKIVGNSEEFQKIKQSKPSDNATDQTDQLLEKNSRMNLNYIQRGYLKKVMFKDEMAATRQKVNETGIDEYMKNEKKAAKLVQQKLAELDFHYGKKQLEQTFQENKKKRYYDENSPHLRGKSFSVMKNNSKAQSQVQSPVANRKVSATKMQERLRGLQKYLKKDLAKSQFKGRDCSVDRAINARNQLSSQELLIGKSIMIQTDFQGSQAASPNEAQKVASQTKLNDKEMAVYELIKKQQMNSKPVPDRIQRLAAELQQMKPNRLLSQDRSTLPHLNKITERPSFQFSGKTDTKGLSYQESSNSLSQTNSQESKEQTPQEIQFRGAPRNTEGSSDQKQILEVDCSSLDTQLGNPYNELVQTQYGNSNGTNQFKIKEGITIAQQNQEQSKQASKMSKHDTKIFSDNVINSQESVDTNTLDLNNQKHFQNARYSPTSPKKKQNQKKEAHRHNSIVLHAQSSNNRNSKLPSESNEASMHRQLLDRNAQLNLLSESKFEPHTSVFRSRSKMLDIYKSGTDLDNMTQKQDKPKIIEQGSISKLSSQYQVESPIKIDNIINKTQDMSNFKHLKRENSPKQESIYTLNPHIPVVHELDESQRNDQTKTFQTHIKNEETQKESLSVAQESKSAKGSNMFIKELLKVPANFNQNVAMNQYKASQKPKIHSPNRLNSPLTDTDSVKQFNHSFKNSIKMTVKLQDKSGRSNLNSSQNIQIKETADAEVYAQSDLPRNSNSSVKNSPRLNTKAPPTKNMQEVLMQLKDAQKKKLIGMKPQKLIHVKKTKESARGDSILKQSIKIKEEARVESQLKIANPSPMRGPMLTSKFDDFNLQLQMVQKAQYDQKNDNQFKLLHQMYAQQYNSDKQTLSGKKQYRALQMQQNSPGNAEALNFLNPMIQTTDYMPYSKKTKDFSFGCIRPDQINLHNQD